MSLARFLRPVGFLATVSRHLASVASLRRVDPEGLRGLCPGLPGVRAYPAATSMIMRGRMRSARAV
jgi:hypothetical protein